MLAISAWFDEVAETAVRDLWRRIAEAGVDGSLHEGPYRPHVTLGVWEELPRDTARTHLAPLLADRAALEIRFRAIGIFPPHPAHADIRHAAVWLAPTVTPELRALHEDVHSAIATTDARPIHRYTPGRWNPHCTLAWQLEPEDALAASAAVIDAAVLPMRATIARVGLIETPAEVELDFFSLGQNAAANGV